MATIIPSDPPAFTQQPPRQWPGEKHAWSTLELGSSLKYSRTRGILGVPLEYGRYRFVTIVFRIQKLDIKRPDYLVV